MGFPTAPLGDIVLLTNMLPNVPAWLPAFFIVLALALASSLPWALFKSGEDNRAQVLKATGFVTLWLTLTGGAAALGKLQDFDSLPPPLVFVLLPMILLCFGIAFTGWGSQMVQGLTLSGMVGLQGFRLPLELVMHQAANYGLMPPQMSYTGRNFDILTGITALLLAFALKRDPGLPRWLVWSWNIVGLGLLINVVTVAILSFPFPFRVFMNEPANIWVTHFPYIWLPAVMVATALTGHLLIFRKLREQKS